MMQLLPGGATGDRDSSAFQGKRASYVALAAIATLALALLLSLWNGADSSSAWTALVGLMGIYLCSTELLLLYLLFTPASILIDFIRTVRADVHPPWFLLLVGMAIKVVGSLFAFSIHRTVTGGNGPAAGFGAGTATAFAPSPNVMYAPVATRNADDGGGGNGVFGGDPFASYAPPAAAISAHELSSPQNQGLAASYQAVDVNLVGSEQQAQANFALIGADDGRRRWGAGAQARPDNQDPACAEALGVTQNLQAMCRAAGRVYWS